MTERTFASARIIASQQQQQQQNPPPPAADAQGVAAVVESIFRVDDEDTAEPPHPLALQLPLLERLAVGFHSWSAFGIRDGAHYLKSQCAAAPRLRTIGCLTPASDLVPIDVHCGVCGTCIYSHLTEYVVHPPQQPHISYELYTDAAPLAASVRGYDGWDQQRLTCVNQCQGALWLVDGDSGYVHHVLDKKYAIAWSREAQTPARCRAPLHARAGRHVCRSTARGDDDAFVRRFEELGFVEHSSCGNRRVAGPPRTTTTTTMMMMMMGTRRRRRGRTKTRAATLTTVQTRALSALDLAYCMPIHVWFDASQSSLISGLDPLGGCGASQSVLGDTDYRVRSNVYCDVDSRE